SSASAPVLSGVNHKSRSGARAAMPTRNPNVYRRYSGRRPAEIFVADDPDPLPREEESSMTPPADGAIHRTEVRLPGSSIGIGQASDYH
ncbi:MAG: hypothetical protein LIP23_02250, partial [Planctomycetes bacterium]|nr:hypothetical protein [Planctomycetota bacterium]